jgi:hypothetical protein
VAAATCLRIQVSSQPLKSKRWLRTYADYGASRFQFLVQDVTGVQAQGVKFRILIIALRLALAAVLVWAVWTVYHSLPAARTSTGVSPAGRFARRTSLHIALRDDPSSAPRALDVPVRLFPVDVAAVQREYFSEPHPGTRFEEFLADKMDRPALTGKFDNDGNATLDVTTGTWWIYATLEGETGLEWQLRVDVSGDKQSVELNPQNLLTRTKSY